MSEPKTGFDLPTIKTAWFPSLLGFLNCLPSTILVGIFYMLPMMIFKQIKPAKFKEKDGEVKIVTFCIPMEVVEGSRLEGKAFWSAMSMGAFVTANRVDRQVDRGTFAKTIMHEQGHSLQQFVFGSSPLVAYSIPLILSWLDPAWSLPWWPLIPLTLFMQPALYILSIAFIWLFMPNYHSYYNNPFEIHARAFAGDSYDDVFITKADWQQRNIDRGRDKNDRFIWL